MVFVRCNVALCLLGAKWFGHWLGERCLGVCSVLGALVLVTCKVPWCFARCGVPGCLQGARWLGVW